MAVTPESATSVVLTKVLLPDAEHVPLEEEADAKLLIGDAALRSAFEDPTPHHDLGRLWLERTGLPMVFAVWAAREPVAAAVKELEDALVESVRQARAEPELLAREASELYGYPPGFLARYFEKLRYRFGPRERAGPLHVPRARPRLGRAGRGSGASLRSRGARAGMTVADVLEKALAGERISDEDALTLLESRDLVAVGRAADELRARKTDPARVTFIVDRNVNYTNVCYTDCDFCAFYRSPGDTREGYLLPKAVIFKKIEETLAIGGTGLLMQGGHHPDLGVEYYEDLFSSIKARYPIHLHALSPSEVQHAARRSKVTCPRR